MVEKTEERIGLEKQATELGLKFTANMKDETLKNKIVEAEGQTTNGGDKGEKNQKGSTSSGLGKIEVIEVVGPKEGFWRAGRYFRAKPVVLVLADLEEKQVEAIEAEPKLACVRKTLNAE